MVAVGAQPAIGARVRRAPRRWRRSRSTTSRPRRSAAAHRCIQSRDRGRHREAGAVGHDRAGGDDVGLGGQLADRGNQRLDEPIAVERDPHLRPARPPCVRRCGTGRLSSSSLASTTPSSGTAGSSSSAVTIGPMPTTGCGASSSARTTGPSASSNGSTVSRSRCAARSAGDRSTSTYRSAAAQSGAAASTSCARRPRPAPASITRIRVGLLQLAPPPVERAGDQRAEQRSDLGAGDEVAPGAPRAPGAGEEAVVAVERELDERVERDRSFPPDPLRDLLVHPAHHPTPNWRRSGAIIALLRRRLRWGGGSEGELADPGDDLRVDADDHGDHGGEPDGDGERSGHRPSGAAAASGAGSWNHILRATAA